MNNINQKEPVNLLVTIDRKYLKPLIHMLDSYKKTHAGIETHVYVVHSVLSEQEIDSISISLNEPTIHVHGICITEQWFKETPVLERLPEESFYRVMAFGYLPSSVKRCLYLDPDIYIMKSLVSLYQIPMDGYCIAAAGHLHGIHNQINRWRLGIERQKQYINSGVMVMNLEHIREHFTISMVLECMDKNVQKLLLGDQDLINILFDGKIKMIDECIYNLDENTRKHNKKKITKTFIEENTAIIHFNGKYKPWLNGYRGILNQYYPYQDEKGPAPRGKGKEQIRSIKKIIFSSMKVRMTLGIICIFLAFMLLYCLKFGKV